MLQSNSGCVCVCACVRACVRVSVCLCVCVISTAQTNGTILMKLYTNDFENICQCHSSRFLKFRIWWSHSGHLALTRCGRTFGPIFFKITDKAQLNLLLFGIENQQDRSITSGRKSGPRSSHIAALVSEPDSEVLGSNPGGGQIFLLWLWMFLVTK